jgi:hypothetical protein
MSRARRARHAEATISSESRLGPFDIYNVKHRVITPPRPMPLESYDHDNECLLIHEHFGDNFEEKAIEIAIAAGIPKSRVSARLTDRGTFTTRVSPLLSAD